MDDFSMLALKAAALREKTATRAGETGLGVPLNTPNGLQPLTAAEQAALVSTPQASKPTAAPTRGGRSALAALVSSLKSRPGRLGLAGVGLAGLGLGASELASRSSASAPTVPPPEISPAPAATSPQRVSPRQQVKQTFLRKAKAGVGNWWGKMHSQYATPRETMP